MLRWLCVSALTLASCSIASGPGATLEGPVDVPALVLPPGPPPEGPGSPRYAHGSVRVTAHGAGDTRYWLYTPGDPVPRSAPVLVYLHGYGARNPRLYNRLLTHLARKGYLIVFPYFGGLLGTAAYEGNAQVAVRDALTYLESGAPTRPQETIAYGGHSLGGLLALRLATRAEQVGLPRPDLLVLHEPAGVSYVNYALEPADLADIAPETRLLIIQAQTSVGRSNAFSRGAFLNTPSIPRERKNLLLLRSDDHGTPALVSDHVGVQTDGGRPLDAIDWWGYFRLTEAALDEALRGRREKSVFCNAQGARCDWVRDTGTWSDGRPVVRAQNAGDLGL